MPEQAGARLAASFALGARPDASGAFYARLTSHGLRDLSACLGYLIAALDLLGLDRVPGVRLEPLAPETGDRILAAVLSTIPDVDPPDLPLEPADGRTWTQPASPEPSAEPPPSVEDVPVADTVFPKTDGGGDTNETPAPSALAGAGAGRAGAAWQRSPVAASTDPPPLPQEDWRGEGLIRSRKRG